MEANKHETSASSADQRLGTAPLTPLIFKLALPTALAQLVNMLYNIVDRIYVGHIPETGSLALAGLGVTYPIIVLITAFSNLIGMGGAPRASVAMGRGDYKTAEKILGNCITLLIALSVALSVVFTIFGEPVLRAFGASENTLPYAMAYLRIYLLGTIFVQFTLGMTPFITNQGFAMTSMATTCIGAVSNIILDPIFIYGFNMGVEGAAIATILSQALSAVWVLIFFTGKRNILRIRKQNLFPSAKTLALVLSLGVSPFLMTATECVIQLAFNTGAAAYGGDDAVAIMTAILSPEIELLGVTTVAGNKEINFTTDNTLRVVDMLRSGVPVYRGCAESMVAKLLHVNGVAPSLVSCRCMLSRCGFSAACFSVVSSMSACVPSSAVKARRKPPEVSSSSMSTAILRSAERRLRASSKALSLLR